MNIRNLRRQKIRYRIRKKISGTATKPRLSVFRSNNDVYLQLIDDVNYKTIVATSTRDKNILAQKELTKTEKSKQAGIALAQKAVELGIQQVVFDRSGYLYHGRIKAVAEGAREGGLQF